MHDESYQPLADITCEGNKKVYCKKHGYNIFVDDCKSYTRVQSGLPPIKDGYIPIGYVKFFAIKKALAQFPDTRWIFFTECDVIITNMETKLESLVKDTVHFIISADTNGLNSGNFFLRNSELGLGFMNNILSSIPMYKHYYLFENQYIQDCLLGTRLTEQGVKNGGSLWAEITAIMPQRYMNSYDYKNHPKLKNRNPVDIFGNDGQWKPGDFILHWPSMTLEQRLDAAKSLLIE
jgi:hypothetical protein